MPGLNWRPLPCQGSALPLRQPPEVETGFEPVYTDLQSAASPLGHSTGSVDRSKDLLRADDGTRTRDPHLGKVMLYQLSHIRVNRLCGRALPANPVTRMTVGDTGIEPVTSSVSGKRAPAAPIARADDGTRTRDPHLGKVMRYQLRYVRMAPYGALLMLSDVAALLCRAADEAVDLQQPVGW